MAAARPGLALAAMLALGGCGPREAVIVVDRMAFGPAPPALHVGDTVVWENKDIFAHTAAADTGGFDVDLPVGGRGRTRLSRAGDIGYHCGFHPGMTGVLHVSP